VELRGFQVGDGAAVVESWRRSMPGDPVSPSRFRDLVLLDPNVDPEGLRLAWDGDELLGFCLAMRRRVPMDGTDLESARGWITAFGVVPEARGRGVGRAVVTSALDWLASRGAREVVFAGYTPNYVLPGLDRARYPAAAALLDAVGFTTLYSAAAMDRSLVGYEVAAEAAQRRAQLETEGWTFGTPESDELVPLVALARDQFNPDWGRAIREAALAGLPLDRIVVARDPSRTIVGWAMHGTYEGVIERFGPFGVLETQRGTGLGKVLLHATLERMRAAGAHSAWFLWTSEESAAGQLYLKTGFTTTRTFDVMQASLGEDQS